MVVRKMKEKCKDAARMRREKERVEFVELSKLLPLPSSTTSQLDKASIIRLTSSYLRMRSAFPQGLGENWGHTTTTTKRHQSFHLSSSSSSQITSLGAAEIGGRSTGVDRQANNNQRQPSNGSTQPQNQQIRELGSLILQTLDGFVFALHKDGKIMYISETASVHLGLPQIDLTGSSLFEFIHPSDYNDINDLFALSEKDLIELEAKYNQENGGSPSAPGTGQPATSTDQCFELGRAFCMRMKCILPKRNAGLVNNGYKAIHCSGYLKVKCRFQRSLSSSSSSSSSVGVNTTNNKQVHESNDQQQQQQSHGHLERIWESYALVAVGHSLLPTASTEVKLNTSSFMFRASLDLKLYYIDASITKLLGYSQLDMINQSLYQFVHVDDSNHLADAHRLLVNKGQVVTRYCRLMRRDGGFIWIESHATLVNNPKCIPKPQHIVSICFVLGENRADQSLAVSELATNQSNTTLASVDKAKANIMSIESGFDKRGSAGSSRSKREHDSSASVEHRSGARKTRKIMNDVKATGASQNTNRKTTSNQSANEPKVHYDKIGYFVACPSPVSSSSTSSSSLGYLNQPGPYQSIGSSRRSSDDTCSVVSSVSSNASQSHLLPECQFQNQTNLMNNNGNNYGHQNLYMNEVPRSQNSTREHDRFYDNLHHYQQHGLQQGPLPMESVDTMTFSIQQRCPNGTTTKLAQCTDSEVWFTPASMKSIPVADDLDTRASQDSSGNSCQLTCSFIGPDARSSGDFNHQSNTWFHVQQRVGQATGDDNCQHHANTNSEMYYHGLNDQPLDGNMGYSYDHMSPYNAPCNGFISQNYFEMKASTDTGPPVQQYQHPVRLGNGYM